MLCYAGTSLLLCITPINAHNAAAAAGAAAAEAAGAAAAYPVINLGVDVVQVGENSSAERVLTVGHTVVEHTCGC
jgi:hypothetical protein